MTREDHQVACVRLRCGACYDPLASFVTALSSESGAVMHLLDRHIMTLLANARALMQTQLCFARPIRFNMCSEAKSSRSFCRVIGKELSLGLSIWCLCGTGGHSTLTAVHCPMHDVCKALVIQSPARHLSLAALSKRPTFCARPSLYGPPLSLPPQMTGRRLPGSARAPASCAV